MKHKAISVVVFLIFFLAVSAYHKCCPEPENDDAMKCGCCPDACCCICDTVITATMPTEPTVAATKEMSTTSKICELTGLDCFFIVDKSLSVGEDNWLKAMNFLGDVVSSPVWKGVGTETKFGMISYNTIATLHWGLNDEQTDSVDSLKDAFLNIPFTEGFTNTPAGLRLALGELENNDRDDGMYPDVVMVVSDGRTNINPSDLEPASNDLQAATEVVFALGISNLTDVNELNLIADGDNNEFVFLVENFDELEEFLAEIVGRLVRSICEIVRPPAKPSTTATPMMTTTPMETCRCCCPPLPDPCDKFPYGDACCCRHAVTYGGGDYGPGYGRR